MGLLYNRVRQAVASAPGTGVITLGAAAAGFQTFAAAGAINGAIVNYVLEDGASWEYGEGTYSSAGPTLTRTTIRASSASGSPVNASASATVFCDAFGEDLQALAQDLFWFGDGSDGDFSASSGTVTLTRDTYYRNLTLSGTVFLDTAGFRLHVSQVANLSGFTGWIGRQAQSSIDGVGSTTGLTPQNIPTNTFGGAVQPKSGATSSGTATGISVSASSFAIGVGAQSGGAGGAGGNGSNGLGGAQNLDGMGQINRPRRPMMDALRGSNTLVGTGTATQGGSSGGGDGTNRGSTGGSGGGGGTIAGIFARTIVTDASTGPRIIRAQGAKGGKGGTQTVGNVGGGGGGAGGGGGWVQVVYRFRSGPTVASAIDVSGADGGDGGAGFGTGTAGKGGGAGWGGYVTLCNLTTGTVAAYLGPQTNTNPTGQTGEIAAIAQTSL